MKRSHKIILGTTAMAAILYLHSRAHDFWGYGQLGVNDRTAQSPVFFVEVRGIGQRPTIAYLVRCPDHSTAPKNFLDVSHSALSQFDERTRVMDRWRSECILLVGRRVGEKIEIRLDRATAQKWFARPGASLGEFSYCQKFWDEVVSPRLADFDRNAG